MSKFDPMSNPAKYAKQRMKGKTKKQSEKDVYGHYYHNTKQIEDTKQYKMAIARYLMDDEEVAGCLNRNIKQDKDKSASNRAIGLWKEMKHPETSEEVGELNIKVSKK